MASARSPSGSAYAASKFALEGWMESLTGELEPFGIRTMIVEPGFFRTELLTPESTTFGELSIDDYDEARAQSNAFWASYERHDRRHARRPTPSFRTDRHAGRSVYR